MKYCRYCGKQLFDEAVFCPGCGCAATVRPVTPPPVNPRPVTAVPVSNENKVSVALILGICGIVLAWLFALLGHGASIVGIVFGAKEYKETGKITGLTLSIVGEVCSIISSLIGVVTVLSYM